jgi:O-acetylserine/cysteine efflux transporter
MIARAPRNEDAAMPLRDMAFAVLVAAIWGLSFIAIKAGVAEAPPLFLTALRFFLAAFPAVLFVPRPSARLVDLAGYGLCIGVGQFGLLFSAISFGMPAGLASLVIQIQALFTLGLVHAVLGQKARGGQIAGALVALAGVGLIGFFRGLSAPMGPFVAVLGAAAFWSVGNLFSIRAGRANMFGFIVWSSLFSPLPLLLLSLAFEDRAAIAAALLHPSVAVWGGAAFLAWVATIIGFGLWSWLLSRHPAAQVTPFALLVPVFGLAGAHLVFGEPLDGKTLLGAAVTILGLAIAVFAGRARSTPRDS